jgi:hypothetical protein
MMIESNEATAAPTIKQLPFPQPPLSPSAAMSKEASRFKKKFRAIDGEKGGVKRCT